MKEAQTSHSPGDDRGVLYGDGLFETLRVEGGKAFFLPRHIRRFLRSADQLGYGQSQIDDAVARLKSIEGRRDGLWRVTVIRSAADAPGGGEGGVYCRWRALPTAEPPPSLTVLSGFYFPGDILGEHKTTSWLRSLEARRRAEVDGFDEALMVSPEGRVGEAAAANVFLWIDQRWVTPVIDGILPGIFREVVLDGAAELGISVEVRPVSLRDLDASEAIVLTSSRRLVSAAASIDGRLLQQEPANELKEALAVFVK